MAEAGFDPRLVNQPLVMVMAPYPAGIEIMAVLRT